MVLHERPDFSLVDGRGAFRDEVKPSLFEDGPHRVGVRADEVAGDALAVLSKVGIEEGPLFWMTARSFNVAVMRAEQGVAAALLTAAVDATEHWVNSVV